MFFKNKSLLNVYLLSSNFLTNVKFINHTKKVSVIKNKNVITDRFSFKLILISANILQNICASKKIANQILNSLRVDVNSIFG